MKQVQGHQYFKIEYAVYAAMIGRIAQVANGLPDAITFAYFVMLFYTVFSYFRVKGINAMMKDSFEVYNVLKQKWFAVFIINFMILTLMELFFGSDIKQLGNW